tara:strand:+ start:168 stop:809 length:642 start_codon:yes stop_codon:yes gene_type:complete
MGDVMPSSNSSGAMGPQTKESGLNKVAKVTANSHVIIALFLIIVSFINKDLKGFIWLTGAILSTIFTQLMLKIIGKNRNKEEIKNCLGRLPGDTNPALAGNIITYTLSYMLFPMMSINNVNLQLVSLLIVLYAVNGYYGLSSKGSCKTMAHEVFFVGISGFLAGYMWYRTLRKNNQEKLLYFTEPISNNSICTKPSKTKFKCRVYKNGELVTD